MTCNGECMAIYELHRAVKNADLRRVSELLNDATGKTDVNQPDHKGWTPLMYAVSSSETDADLLRVLIHHGAKIDQTSVSFALDDLQKLTLLIEAGAKIRYQKDGYDALIHAAYGRNALHNPQLLDVLKLLIAKGVPLHGMTSYGESAVRVLSRIGRFDAVHLLLQAGADPNDIKFTPLLEAAAFGSLADVREAVRIGANLEDRDHWERTAWLIAIQTGDIGKASFLLESGADISARGRCGEPPLFYAIENGQIPMLEWLLDVGFDIEQTDEFGCAALRNAVDCCNEECVEILLRAGADVDRESGTGTALGNASTRGVAIKLLKAGADPQHLTRGARRSILGFPSEPDEDLLEVSESDFHLYRSRRFAERAPEVMNNPFWEGMIRSSIDAYQAGRLFGIEEKFDGTYTPIWCAQRFGQSLTFLPDGRIVQVAGEHEDHYDPDFCIYNDVFVHFPGGNILIYGYPESVFPPTDFHTATTIGEAIYLIGSLGYPAARRYGETPVYRLDTLTFELEPLPTAGEAPGWIYKHQAVASGSGEIRVFGGEILSLKDGEVSPSGNVKVYILDVERRVWRIQ